MDIDEETEYEKVKKFICDHNMCIHCGSFKLDRNDLSLYLHGCNVNETTSRTCKCCIGKGCGECSNCANELAFCNMVELRQHMKANYTTMCK